MSDQKANRFPQDKVGERKQVRASAKDTKSN